MHDQMFSIAQVSSTVLIFYLAPLTTNIASVGNSIQLYLLGIIIVSSMCSVSGWGDMLLLHTQ